MDTLKSIDIKKLFDSNYILEPSPTADSLYLYLGIIFGLFILFAILSWFGYQRMVKENNIWKRFRGRVFNFFLYIGLLGIILIFSRYEGIAYLGSRLFLLILLWIFLIWGVYILNYRLRVIPGELRLLEEKAKYTKYLPRAGRNRKKKGIDK